MSTIFFGTIVTIILIVKVKHLTVFPLQSLETIIMGTMKMPAPAADTLHGCSKIMSPPAYRTAKEQSKSKPKW